MGCGSSTVGVAGTDNQLNNNNNGHKTHGSPNGNVKKAKDANSADKKANPVSMDQAPVPKSVAFDVTLDGQSTNLLAKRPPRKLQVLDPLDVPRLSAEQLAEKQRLAEEKRLRVLQKKANASKKASRRRQELAKARQVEAQTQQQQEKALDEHQRQAELKREARLKEIQEKQRIREERAKRARERAKRLNNPEDGSTLEVEKDEQFNASDADSWLGEEEGSQCAASEPQKAVQRVERTTASASTVDSYDAAFQRPLARPLPQPLDQHEQRDDDFFGS